MSKLLALLFKKERHEWFTRGSSKSLSKSSDSLKKFILLVCFRLFSLLLPFLCPTAYRSRRSFLMRDGTKNKRFAGKTEGRIFNPVTKQSYARPDVSKLCSTMISAFYMCKILLLLLLFYMCKIFCILHFVRVTLVLFSLI